MLLSNKILRGLAASVSLVALAACATVGPNFKAPEAPQSAAAAGYAMAGDAASQAQKDLTTEYAQDVEGVKEVKNEMTVTGKPAGPTLAEIIDDASINAQVRMALLTHRSTSAFRTLVATTDGVVMLGGFAKNTAEIDLVTKLVTDIHGVKSVVNNMVVEAGTAKN